MDTSKAWIVFVQIESEGTLEDRREYDKDMLQTMYSLNQYEAERLYDLIQDAFGAEDPILKARNDLFKYLRIRTEVGENMSDGAYQRLGRFIHDYLTSAIYDMNWEGFSDEQLHGVKTLLRDMAIGAEAEHKHNTYGSEEV